jgi:ribonuclease H / adenosylcobalamin/alpha-ribazole phosphatase
MAGDPKHGYYLLNTDGGMKSDGHRQAGDPPGMAAIGVVLRTPSLAPLAECSKTIGPATQNVAEYRALIAGLCLAWTRRIERIRVYMDSELVVEQMNERSRVRKPHLRALYEQAARLEARFASIRISWIPRKLNAEADHLVRKALGAS